MTTTLDVAQLIADFLEDRVHDADGRVLITEALDETVIFIPIGDKNYTIVIREAPFEM